MAAGRSVVALTPSPKHIVSHAGTVVTECFKELTVLPDPTLSALIPWAFGHQGFGPSSQCCFAPSDLRYYNLSDWK